MSYNSPILSLKNITKTFGQKTILSNVNLEAYSNDVIALIGPSGAGKSTLLRCINLLEIPNEGEVWINGEELKFKTLKNKQHIEDIKQVQKIRSSVPMVFQNFNLWSHKTILQNIIEAPIHVLKRDKEECIAQARELLKKVDIVNKENEYPSALSGGQQQRVAIARALAMNPKIILFDEPTSALDPELVGEVLRVIKSLANEGVTMIIVTHELSFAKKVSNKIMYLENGACVEFGLTSEIFEQPKTDRLQRFLFSNFLS